jgi:hypothetical protein
MRAVRRSVYVILFLALVLSGADQSWTGQLTDSVCAQYHPSQVGSKRGEAADLATRRDCTLLCIRNGADYVFVSEGKVFQISKQDDPELMTHAGENVKVSGTLKENTITISKIENQ